MGETRETRIKEFLEENSVPVLGLREGSWLNRCGSRLTLCGSTGARLFMRHAEVRELASGCDLSFLLDAKPRFDCIG